MQRRIENEYKNGLIMAFFYVLLLLLPEENLKWLRIFVWSKYKVVEIRFQCFCANSGSFIGTNKILSFYPFYFQVIQKQSSSYSLQEPLFSLCPPFFSTLGIFLLFITHRSKDGHFSILTRYPPSLACFVLLFYSMLCLYFPGIFLIRLNKCDNKNALDFAGKPQIKK